MREKELQYSVLTSVFRKSTLTGIPTNLQSWSLFFFYKLISKQRLGDKSIKIDNNWSGFHSNMKSKLLETTRGVIQKMNKRCDNVPNSADVWKYKRRPYHWINALSHTRKNTEPFVDFQKWHYSPHMQDENDSRICRIVSETSKFCPFL